MPVISGGHGPVRTAKKTVGFADFGGQGGNFPVKVTDLAAGEIVWGVTAIVTVSFGANTPVLNFAMAPVSDLTNSNDLQFSAKKLDILGTVDPTYLLGKGWSGAGASPTLTVPISLGASSLVVYYATSGPDAVAGSVDCYALIVAQA